MSRASIDEALLPKLSDSAILKEFTNYLTNAASAEIRQRSLDQLKRLIGIFLDYRGTIGLEDLSWNGDRLSFQPAPKKRLGCCPSSFFISSAEPDRCRAFLAILPQLFPHQFEKGELKEDLGKGAYGAHACFEDLIRHLRAQDITRIAELAQSSTLSTPVRAISTGSMKK